MLCLKPYLAPTMPPYACTYICHKVSYLVCFEFMFGGQKQKPLLSHVLSVEHDSTEVCYEVQCMVHYNSMLRGSKIMREHPCYAMWSQTTFQHITAKSLLSEIVYTSKMIESCRPD